MDRQQIETIVLKVLATLLKCEVCPESSRENMLYWDSLKHIEIIFAVEDELGLQFSEDELANLDSVASIVDIALSHHAS
jgi:acyl carrier protein